MTGFPVFKKYTVTVLLPLIQKNVESDRDNWQRFVERCKGLTDKMEMATCDGCDSCGMRCTDGFGVTRIEYDTAVAYFATLPTGEQNRIRAQQKTVAWNGGEDTDATITYCRWRDLEKSQCAIYPARPTVCRLFGHTHWLPCPIEAVTNIPDGSASLWNDYRKWERHTWDEWELLVE